MYEIQSPVEKEQICLFGHLLTPSEDKSGQRERDTGKREKKVLDHPDSERGGRVKSQSGF